MTTKQSASSRVQIASHNPIDLVSHNEYVAQDIHQKIELMRYFLTTNHQWENSLCREFQPKDGHSTLPVIGGHLRDKFKHYLSYFSLKDTLKLVSFIVFIPVMWLLRILFKAFFATWGIILFFGYIGIFFSKSSLQTYFLFKPLDFVIFALMLASVIFLEFILRRGSPNFNFIKIIWIKDSNLDLTPVVLCLLPEWLNPNLNLNKLSITGEIDPLTLKRMWLKLTLFEKHVIMSDLKIGGVTNGEPQIHSVEFVNGSLPYRDELISSIYRGQPSKKL